MTFKEAYDEDLKDVFFDPEEFGSEHMIDGEILTVVLMETIFEGGRLGANLKNAFNPKESAINQKTFTLCIREEDVKRKLTVNATIKVDGKNMFVNEVKHTMGMCRLIVSEHRV